MTYLVIENKSTSPDKAVLMGKYGKTTDRPTLGNQIPFIDVEMILLPFFEFYYEDKLAINVKKQCVQVIPRSIL